MEYTYHINLDERGEFYADVRDQDEKTIFEIKNDDDGSLWLIDAGYMKHKEDTDGLAEYLRDMGFIGHKATINL